MEHNEGRWKKEKHIVTMLEKHQEMEPISFHVPGHKNGLLWDENSLLRRLDLGNLDVTELSGLDNLHYPEEGIYCAKEKLREYYGTKESFFLVNGTTCGILAMIKATLKAGDRVLVQRQVHQSILNGLELTGVIPIFISQKIICGFQDNNIISSRIIKEIREQTKFRAIVITYPSYYGEVYNIGEIVREAHNRDAIVLVDEAHGAHFGIGNPFPSSALSSGADVVVHSAHKTLPALTMGSYLHVNSNRVSITEISKYLRIFQTSSPSYPVMLSLDIARDYIENFSQEDVQRTIEEVDKFCREIERIEGMYTRRFADPIKVHLRYSNHNGYTLGKKLQAIGVFPELSDMFGVLLIFPLVKVGIKYPFGEAIRRIRDSFNASAVAKCNKKDELFSYATKTGELAYKFEEMERLSVKEVILGEAVGRVSATNVIPYPPGVAVLMRGEIVTEEVLVIIDKLCRVGALVYGAEKIMQGKLEVFYYRK